MLVAFVFAIAALLSGRLDSVHLFCPPVDAGGVGVPTLGIVLGLGVGLLRAGLGRLVVRILVENAFGVPWLAGTALLHSLAVEQRAGFKGVDAAAVHLRLSRCACWAPSGCARSVGARLRLRPGARNVYPRLYGVGHRRSVAAVARRAGTGCVRCG